MDEALQARVVVAVLADEARLRVLSAIVLGASSLGDVAAATGLDVKDASRALARLGSAGLVDCQAYCYRVRLEALRACARDMAEPEEREPGSLGRFIRGGRLVAWPAAVADRLLVLNHLAALFEPERRYTEPDVNEVLAAVHADSAAMRRYLVDHGLLKRTHELDNAGRSVTIYWRPRRMKPCPETSAIDVGRG